LECRISRIRSICTRQIRQVPQPLTTFSSISANSFIRWTKWQLEQLFSDITPATIIPVLFYANSI
jgi:hypothetical protein